MATTSSRPGKNQSASTAWLVHIISYISFSFPCTPHICGHISWYNPLSFSYAPHICGTSLQSRRADRFRPEKIPPNLDTIVIGSGSGGSTVANLLAQSGQRVLVLEQHSVTGGCTHSFREEGCEYDTGLVRNAYHLSTVFVSARFVANGSYFATPYCAE